MFIIVVSGIILLFTTAYVLVIISSNNRIIDEQQKKIEEVKKSEQRYKALFENSLAGMMKFSFSPLIVFEANRTMLEMFNAHTAYDLQRIMSELPNNGAFVIETALKKSGIIESYEIDFVTVNNIKRRFLFSAKKEDEENLAHAVIVLMTSEKLIG